MRIPRFWVKVLAEVQETFPNAVIAGGAIRDLYLKYPANDVDIFLPETTHGQLQEYIGTLSKKIQLKDIDDLSTSFENLDIKSDVDYQNLTDVEGVFTSTYIHDVPIQFIAMNVTKDKIMDHFDFGICKVMYDRFNFLPTEDFKHDLKNKKFTLVGCKSRKNFDKSLQRWKKFERRYHDFELDTGRFNRSNLP